MFAHQFEAQVAELVDALVSNTNDSNIVPVRPRPWVHKSLRIVMIRRLLLFRGRQNSNRFVQKILLQSKLDHV